MGKVVPEWRPLVERIIKAFEEYLHEDDPTWEADESLWQEIINIVSAWFEKPPDEASLWAKCDECDWGPHRYETAGQAKTALTSHKRKHRRITGFEVFRSAALSSSCDLAILKGKRLVRVEVRTGKRSPTGKVCCPTQKIKTDILAIVLPDQIIYKSLSNTPLPFELEASS